MASDRIVTLKGYYIQVLNDEMERKVNAALEGFEGSNYLLEKLESYMSKGMDKKPEEPGEMNILENIVLADYPLPNPSAFSQFYDTAIFTDNFKPFAAFLEHLNKFKGRFDLAKSVTPKEHKMLFGDKRDGTELTYSYSYTDNSYLSLVFNLFYKVHENNIKLELATETLTMFENHFEKLAKLGIDVDRFVHESGYIKRLKASIPTDEEELKKYQKRLNWAEQIFEELSKKEIRYNIYAKPFVQTISSCDGNGLQNLGRMIRLYNPNVLLKSPIGLELDLSEKPEHGRKTAKAGEKTG